MAKSIPGQLSMWHLMTSEPSPSATSSQASEGGAMPSVSPDGLTTAPFGQARALASRSRSQAKAPVQTIQGTCGPTSIASSPPSGPLSQPDRRLRDAVDRHGERARLDGIGQQRVRGSGGSVGLYKTAGEVKRLGVFSILAALNRLTYGKGVEV